MPLRVLTCSYMIFMLLVSDGWRMGGQYIGVTLRRFGVKFQNQFKKSFPSLSREKRKSWALGSTPGTGACGDDKALTSPRTT